jgi:hypothetical protein
MSFVRSRLKWLLERVGHVIVILSKKVKNSWRSIWPLLKRLFANLRSVLNFAQRKISKKSAPLMQRKSITSDKDNTSNTGKNRSIGVSQLLRRIGIITAAKLEETIIQTKDVIKHEIEVGKQDLESSQPIPLENTIKRTNLNEELAEQIRKQTGLDCEAPRVGSLEIEYKQYYSNNFPLSPKITTNRGCILVKGRRFSIIQIIQRN